MHLIRRTLERIDTLLLDAWMKQNIEESTLGAYTQESTLIQDEINQVIKSIESFNPNP
jgi:hypothetical protein